METVLIVLIGPPAVGKSVLAEKLHFSLKNSRVFSFDQEFPLEKIIENENQKNSKDFRQQFLKIIQSSESLFDWLIVDDTCHLNSMQKRFMRFNSIVVFLYISARLDQIPQLQERNLNRSSRVKCEEIEKITNHLNTFEPIPKNLIKFNFENVPEIDDLIESIKEAAFSNYKHITLAQSQIDHESDSNFWNKLNLALNKEISNYFKSKRSDGLEISKQKKMFLAQLRGYESNFVIEEVVEEFRLKYLNE